MQKIVNKILARWFNLKGLENAKKVQHGKTNQCNKLCYCLNCASSKFIFSNSLQNKVIFFENSVIESVILCYDEVVLENGRTLLQYESVIVKGISYKNPGIHKENPLWRLKLNCPKPKNYQKLEVRLRKYLFLVHSEVALSSKTLWSQNSSF